MKKHSPDFHQNLFETERAETNIGDTALLVIAAAIMIAMAFS